MLTEMKKRGNEDKVKNIRSILGFGNILFCMACLRVFYINTKESLMSRLYALGHHLTIKDN